MSSWPPTPQDPNTPNTAAQPSGREWALIQGLLFSNLKEQQSARRWRVFFTLVRLALAVIFFVLIVKSCSSSTPMSLDASLPHLAVVDVQGEISHDSPANGRDLIDALDQAFEATNSTAVVLNINSPGGSPVESDNVWLEIRRLQALHKDKKVYAVVGDMAASGAYYIASAADEIWVNPSSLVGSIGVIMPNYGVSELAKKLGVEDRTITAGAHKNILNMTKPIDPVELKHVQGVLDNVHQHFIGAVRQGRGARLKENADMFSGLFWSGEQAIGLGLADKTGNINTLARQLKIDHQVNYSVQPDPVSSLLGRFGVSMRQEMGQTIRQGVDAALSGSATQVVLK